MSVFALFRVVFRLPRTHNRDVSPRRAVPMAGQEQGHFLRPRAARRSAPAWASASGRPTHATTPHTLYTMPALPYAARLAPPLRCTGAAIAVRCDDRLDWPSNWPRWNGNRRRGASG
jgi:hypothetical protein